MYQLIRPLLFRLNPEAAHIATLNLLSRFGRKRLPPETDPVELWGLRFPNKVGMAAGWDKNGDCIDALFGLGFGFVEVGTVTPRPQVGNSKPRLFRVPQAGALINRMGFNNMGVAYLVQNLERRRLPGIVGVNIGKNKSTPNELAYEDYVHCLEKVYPYASYITINISSPNTPGLRDLQSEQALDVLLTAVMNRRLALADQYQRQVPIVVKLSPDYPHQEIEVFVNMLLKHQVDGVIATNTSVDHSAVEHFRYGQEQGGLSGIPICSKSTDTISEIHRIAGNQLPIIGVGGIHDRLSAQEKYNAGATLIQLYTGMIYKGPKLIKQLALQAQIK